MDVRKLEYFETVARLGNFTKAAEELHVSQPSITISIRSLEEELGVTLMSRNQRRVLLTTEGEILYQKAKHILADVNNTMQQMKDLGKAANKVIRIGISPIIGGTLFPLLFSGYRKVCPDVRYHILEKGSHGILEELIKGSIMLGYIVFLPDLEDRFNVLQTLQGEIHALLHKDSPLCRYDRVPFSVLASQPLIYLPTHSFLRREVDQLFSRHGIIPQVIHEPSQMITTFELVAAGLGVSFLLHNQMHMVKNNSLLVTRPLEDQREYRAGFVWKKDGYLSEISRKLLDYVQENM